MELSETELGENSGEYIYTALMIVSLVITVFSFLLFVDYEWCPVLFKNNTVTRRKGEITKLKILLFLELVLGSSLYKIKFYLFCPLLHYTPFQNNVNIKVYVCFKEII